MRPTSETWKLLLDLSERHGLEVSALSCYQDYANPDSLDRRIEDMKVCLDYARYLPNPVVITEAGGTYLAEGGQRASEWYVLVEAMKRTAEHAARANAYIAMEPGGGGLVASVESMCMLIDEVGSPHLRLNLDPANITMHGSDAVRAARELGPIVIHTHAKDGAFYYRLTAEQFAGILGKFRTFEDMAVLLDRETPPCNEFPLGQGQVDWRAYVHALDEAGYTGPFVIERETGDDPVSDIAQAVEFLAAL
jgi:sugar phosphate isomerase/epimerase